MAGLSGGFSWLALAVGSAFRVHGRAGLNRLKHNTLVLLCKRIDYQWVSLLSPRGGDKIAAHRGMVSGSRSAGRRGRSAGGMLEGIRQGLCIGAETGGE